MKKYILLILYIIGLVVMFLSSVFRDQIGALSIYLMISGGMLSVITGYVATAIKKDK